jgi:hypothetical protein
LAAKCITGLRSRFLESAANFFPAPEIATDESRPLVHGAAMPFGQVIEDDDLVALIEQQLDANAPDIACPADDKNSHPRKVRRASRLSKESRN